MSKKSQRQLRMAAKRQKPGNKNPVQTVRRLEAQKEAIEAKLAQLNDGTPNQLSSAMRRTWVDNPSSERIVEDMTRYPLIIDKIVEHKGGVVPDFVAQHAGCSRRKRKATEGSRLYTPSTEVLQIRSERNLQLRAEAQRLCGK